MISIRHDVYTHDSVPSPATSAILARILESLNAIMSTQTELLAVLTEVKNKLAEASTELTAKIAELTAAVAAAGQTTPRWMRCWSKCRAWRQPWPTWSRTLRRPPNPRGPRAHKGPPSGGPFLSALT